MSPSPEQLQEAAIERIESAIRAGMPLLVALHAERDYLLDLPLAPSVRALLERLARFDRDADDFDKVPSRVRLAFDRALRQPAADLLRGKRD